MATATGTFESTVREYLTRKAAFHVKEDRYKFNDIWLQPSQDGSAVRVSFRALRIPPGRENPPDPYGDLDNVHLPRIHEGAPPPSGRFDFTFELPDDELQASRDESSSPVRETVGGRVYHYTFTDSVAEAKRYELFQSFLNENVASPEELEAENQSAWAEAFEAAERARRLNFTTAAARSDATQSSVREKTRRELLDLATQNRRMAKTLLWAYYVGGVLSLVGTHVVLLFTPVRTLFGQMAEIPSICFAGTFLSIAQLFILKLCVTRAQRDLTAALFYREGALSLGDIRATVLSETRVAGRPDGTSDAAGANAVASNAPADRNLDPTDAVAEDPDVAATLEVEKSVTSKIRRSQVPVSIWSRPELAAALG